MKATGIVRRIDDLGRVVIPKEIRRTLRIREGAPLEIYTGSNGEIIFKKYSPMEEISIAAAQYAEVLYKTIELPVLICDHEQVIAAAGISKKEVLERRISSEWEEMLTQRQTYQKINQSTGMQPVDDVSRSALIGIPILSNGDLSGSILFLEDDHCHQADDTLLKLATTAALFFGKQMEP